MLQDLALIDPVQKAMADWLLSRPHSPLGLRDCFDVRLESNGTATFTHKSGSKIVFWGNGDVGIYPKRDLVIDPERMVRIATTEEEAEAYLSKEQIRGMGG